MPDRCLKDQINVLKCFLVLKKGMEFGGLFWGTDILGAQGWSRVVKLSRVFLNQAFLGLDQIRSCIFFVALILTGKLTCFLKINGWKMYFLLK